METNDTMVKLYTPVTPDKWSCGGEVITKQMDEGKWIQENQGTLGIIQRSLSSSILEADTHEGTAKELLESMEAVYKDRSHLGKVFVVKRAIEELKQDGEELSKHLERFKSLWAELKALRPSTLDKIVLKRRLEQDEVLSLLLSLDKSYDKLARKILTEETLPDVESVCGMLKQKQATTQPEERRQITELQQVISGKSLYSAYIGDIKDGDELKNRHEKGRADEVITRREWDAFVAEAKALIASKKQGIQPVRSKPIIVHYGASHHMISDRSLMDEVRAATGDVQIANGDKIPIEGIGNLKLFDRESTALYLPQFTSNLIYVKRATVDLQCQVVFRPEEVEFQDLITGQVIGKGSSTNNLYQLQSTKLSKPSISICMSSTADDCDSITWHARLGHPHPRALELMMPNLSVNHLECEACILGKHCKTVFPTSETVYEKCFDLIHSDVWTSPCISRDKHKYFVTFIDEKSKYTWVTLLPSKDRVLEAFINFQAYVTNQYNATVKVLRSDNGGEYTSHAFKNHLMKHGIVHQTSCPYTPQQNGVAERKNRHLMEVARSMMFHSNVPKRFWSDAVVSACYLINRTPTKVLRDLSPFEVLNKSRPQIQHLRVFGCTCYVLVPGELRKKLDAKSTKAMFIGYSITQKGYKCYDPTTGRVLVSRDVKFIEGKGYYEEKIWDDLKDLPQMPSDKTTILRMVLENLGISRPRIREQEENHQEAQVLMRRKVKGSPLLIMRGEVKLNQECNNNSRVIQEVMIKERHKEKRVQDQMEMRRLIERVQDRMRRLIEMSMQLCKIQSSQLGFRNQKQRFNH